MATAASSSSSSAGGSNSSKSQRNFKVVLLGEGCVGKTSIALRFVEGKFSDQHVTTLQASFLTKRLQLPGGGGRGERVTLSIWDTAGQERFHALGPIYYRDADGAVLVYDITDADSFQKVKIWVKELRKMLGSGISLCIAGNKSDLEDRRRVDAERAEEYAKAVGAKHFFTSAKMDLNVEEAFTDLAAQMMEKDKRKKDSNKRSGGGGISIVGEGGGGEGGGEGRRRPKCCGGGGGDEGTVQMPVDDHLLAAGDDG